MIPQSFIQELLNRVDIVELIGKTVPLKKTGKNLMGCCPFHKEKTPSFSVSAQKQFYKCFGCGASGSAIGFVMQYEGLSYPEAIRKLAESVGMQVPEEPGERQRNAKAKTLTDRMQQATSFYCDSLRHNQHIIDYLKSRGITGETAARFALGYSPDAWQALKDVFAEHYDDPEMEEQNGCGLVIVNDNGRRYDRFRGRLMFPIRNPRGQVIGFGARTMNGDEQPKYLNSPETAIYHKGLEIYGLYEAQDVIRQKDRAIVCEGYMDVIQLSQAGFTESVAALGTSITSDHVKKLLKLVDTVYFSFDGDAAGQKALRRALEAALPVVGDSQTIRFVRLPEQHDPDSLIKEQGAHAFEEQLAKSLTLTEFFVRSVGEGKNLASAEGRSQMLAEAKPLVAMMRSAPILRTQLIAELAAPARMSPDDTARALGVVSPVSVGASVRGDGQKPRWKNTGYRNKAGGATRLEPLPSVGDKNERLLQYLLVHPKLAAEFSGAIAEEIHDRAELGDVVAEQIVEVWRAVTEYESPIEVTSVLLDALRSSPNSARYQALVAKEMVLQTPEAIARMEIQMALLRLELETVEQRKNEAMQAAPLDMELIKKLFARQKQILEHLEDIKAQQVRLVGDMS